MVNSNRLHPLALLLLVLAALALAARSAVAQTPEPAEKVREIFVPFKDLNVLLENQPRRVMLSREEYEDLLTKARKSPDTSAPQDAVLLSAEYTATLEPQRAAIRGVLVIEVLNDGLHAVDLDLGGVGLRSAILDGHSAALGASPVGRPKLFVQGKGQHTLTLEMVAPVEATAAQQVLSLRLPRAPASRLHLTVPGDVEIKSGAEVVSRRVDDAAGQTRFELVPKAGDMAVAMSLNSRLQRRDQAVVARSVLVDEVTQAYERLHATVSLEILHRAADAFRFVVPDGFEMTEVSSPLLSRWEVKDDGPRKVLHVRLREQTTDPVLLSLMAVKTPSRLEDWRLPRLEALDVVGQVAVVGLVAEERLQAQSLAAEGLLPIDTAVLGSAIPATIARAEPGTPTLRPVAAYYAPQSEFSLRARFDKPAAQTAVTSNVLLILADRGLEVRAGWAIVPEVQALFAVDLSVPAGWKVTAVTTADEKPLAFESYPDGRVHVRLPKGVQPGEEFRLYLHAVRTPQGWLADWQTQSLEFPKFALVGAARDAGALAVQAGDDISVHPDRLEQLTPLDEADKARYGLGSVATNLAYRYDAAQYGATLKVLRVAPRLTARSLSFFRLTPDALVCHYELTYRIDDARARQLVFTLPETTPAALMIRGLDNLQLKEYGSRDVQGGRQWTVLLAEPSRGAARLTVDFQQPLKAEEPKDLSLPVVRVEDVEYQSGLVAVEGSAELDVQVKPGDGHRRVDVGELAGAEYQPGQRLLGAYQFIGRPRAISIDVFRHPGYALHPAIVQKAELVTHLSAQGMSQTQARFQLRTKAVYLEVGLPAEAELWSAELDGTPIKPQREGESLLVNLPAAAVETLRNLQIVYQQPVSALGLVGRMSVPAPRLRLHAGHGATAIEVPLADLEWQLHLPAGYVVTRTAGTVATGQVERPELAAITVGKALVAMTGGFTGGWMMPASQSVREAAKSVRRGGPLPTGGWGDPYSVREDETAAKAPVAPAEEEARLEDKPALKFPVADLVIPVKPAEPPLPEPKAEVLMFDQARKPAEAPAQPAPAYPSLVPTTPALPATGGEKLGQRLEPSENFAAALERPLAGRAAPDKGPKPRPKWAGLQGVRSLKIDLDQTRQLADNVLSFQSLGAEPELVVTLAHRSRMRWLGWGLALAVLLAGLAMTNHPVRQRIAYLVVVALVTTFLPLLIESVELTRICNRVFLAASLLVPYYLLVALAKWLLRPTRRMIRRATALLPAPSSLLLLAVAASLALGSSAPVFAQQSPGISVDTARDLSDLVQLIAPRDPVQVPDDAVILPYDPESRTGVQNVHRLLVPYARYVELWNRAHPDKKIDAHKPPAPYALAGATYNTRLVGDEYLAVTGRIHFDIFTHEHVMVSLALGGGVLAQAELDGKPARVGICDAPEPPTANKPAAAAQPNTAPSSRAQRPGDTPEPQLIVLHASGKGRHTLDLAVRLRLTKQGGWRVAEGSLPAAPATAMAVTVPEPKTEVRLGQVRDRRSCETDKPDQTIDTALDANGAVSLRWRPKVAEGEVDRSLTASSAAVLDVEEDGLRLLWQLGLEFRRGQREQFTVDAPREYLVEKVEGANVRGWEVRPADDRQTIEVTLLKAVKDREQFSLRLMRRAAVGRGGLVEFDMPVVTVRETAMHSGHVAVRRSPMLDLRAVATAGVTRADMTDAALPAGAPAAADRPLGLRPFQAYRFVTVPFSLRMAAEPVVVKANADVQTVLKIAEYERSLESRVVLQVQDRPVHTVRMFLPEDFRLRQVLAPGQFQWAVTEQQGRPLLSIYLAAGQIGEVPVVLQGVLGNPGYVDKVALPRLEVLDVQRQQGQIAVQVDPAFDLETRDLANCETVLVGRLFGWLNPEQRDPTRLALHYGRADYGGTLQLSARTPVVQCTTITNLRVTDRAVEETILLDFTIHRAGVRELSFLLPASMARSRIQVPKLRQKTVTAVDDKPGSPLRVKLRLQDDVMGQLRVLVENDRLLTAAVHQAAIPVVENCRTDRRFVTLESAGRDEVVVDENQLSGLDVLSRQQKDWQTLRAILGTGITQAYLARPDAAQPRLAFQTRSRAAVQTVGARIGLAETVLVLDANGAYRAQFICQVDNSTEQYLKIRLPEDAELWTAVVAGEAVKPVRAPAAPQATVLIPLIKTAAGSLDYPVVLKYGGKLSALGRIGRVRFPLVHTENINVQRSQVRLYVPQSHQWFDFGGTMRLETDEATLAAEQISYQTKQAERLIEVARHGDKFAKARAVSNLKQLEETININNDSLQFQAANNPNLQNALTVNAGTLRNLSELEQASKQTVTLDDNREKLNVYYSGQGNIAARNTLQGKGNNFYSGGTTVNGGAHALNNVAPNAPPGRTSNTFNDNWLATNSLNVSSVVVGPSAVTLTDGRTLTVGGDTPQTPTVPGQPVVIGGWPQPSTGVTGVPIPRIQFEGKSGAVMSRAQPAAPEVAQGKTKMKLAESLGGKGGKDLNGYRSQVDEDRDTLARYKVRLEQQARQQVVQNDYAGVTNLKSVAGLNWSAEAGRQGGGQGGIVDGLDRGNGTLRGGELVRGPLAAPSQTAAAPAQPGGGRGGQPLSGKDGDFPAAVQLTDGLRASTWDETHGTAAAAAQVAPAATGLASLDVELPMRGQLYRFTTPGGDVEITAQAASRDTLLYLGQVAAVLAVVLVVWAMVRLARAGRLAWLASPGGSTLLIVLGILGVFVGVLPVLALAAFVAGVVLKVRRASRRRTTQAVTAELVPDRR